MGPPLIMTSFIENAFKHGISYEQKSFIKVRTSIDEGMLSFCCINSKTKQRTDTQHGLGMDNTRKRLDGSRIPVGEIYRQAFRKAVSL